MMAPDWYLKLIGYLRRSGRSAGNTPGRSFSTDREIPFSFATQFGGGGFHVIPQVVFGFARRLENRIPGADSPVPGRLVRHVRLVASRITKFGGGLDSEVVVKAPLEEGSGGRVAGG